MRNIKPSYESSPEFDADAYTVDGFHKGIAFSALGWETEPDDDTEWSGIEERTGNLIVRMVGDDRCWSVDPSDVHPIEREDYCGECGQVGCVHDGYEREGMET